MGIEFHAYPTSHPFTSVAHVFVAIAKTYWTVRWISSQARGEKRNFCASRATSSLLYLWTCVAHTSPFFHVTEFMARQIGEKWCGQGQAGVREFAECFMIWGLLITFNAVPCSLTWKRSKYKSFNFIMLLIISLIWGPQKLSKFGNNCENS